MFRKVMQMIQDYAEKKLLDEVFATYLDVQDAAAEMAQVLPCPRCGKLTMKMRRKADPNTPWYTLEVEPGGTVRQKRSYNNDQYADLEGAKPFIAEWQQVVQSRMTAAEIDFARQSKEIRAQEFAELKENGNIIRTGANAGKLLVDELMHDLMEVEKRVG